MREIDILEIYLRNKYTDTSVPISEENLRSADMQDI